MKCLLACIAQCIGLDESHSLPACIAFPRRSILIRKEKEGPRELRAARPTAAATSRERAGKQAIRLLLGVKRQVRKRGWHKSRRRTVTIAEFELKSGDAQTVCSGGGCWGDCLCVPFGPPASLSTPAHPETKPAVTITLQCRVQSTVIRCRETRGRIQPNPDRRVAGEGGQQTGWDCTLAGNNERFPRCWDSPASAVSLGFGLCLTKDWAD
ncbi:hypothetical protein BO86DRAFT_45743 [Aspergillus japonicus CBS 114.51]|uniref:Uncharacterized protein n=2 Tax=Aspergillus TaxID=5052 RepID=A0A2V5H4X4_ASPV1|nr:hypothetical protein BO86DRAFT_45743 [Aspergillus japonicus CBS 114.51]PYI15893.1 hypothetical protein BO99DRAFT_235364 [Aspergillus violaceofuscus CBS 115571]RAH75846.1 hypothetical protein BO86DRAFT_45743 [Aspergillus japonicus CBS 114.51]